MPEQRTTNKWLTARSQREGAISALIEKRRHPGLTGDLRTVSKSQMLLGMSRIRAARLWLRSGSATIGCYYIHAAIGRLMAEFGEINEQYRNPDSD